MFSALVLALLLARGAAQLAVTRELPASEAYALGEVLRALTGRGVLPDALARCRDGAFMARAFGTVRCRLVDEPAVGDTVRAVPHVVELAVAHIVAGATLSPAVAGLLHLEVLSINAVALSALSDPGLSLLVGGRLPSLSRLTRLRVLEIPFNALTGTVPSLPPSLVSCQLVGPLSDPLFCCPLDVPEVCRFNFGFKPPYELTCMPGFNCVTGELDLLPRDGVDELPPLRKRRFTGVARSLLALGESGSDLASPTVRVCLDEPYEAQVTLTTTDTLRPEMRFELSGMLGDTDPRLRLPNGFQLRPFQSLPLLHHEIMGYLADEKILLTYDQTVSFAGAVHDCHRLEVDDDGTLHLWMLSSVTRLRGCVFSAAPPRAPICRQYVGSEKLPVEAISGVPQAGDAWFYVRLEPADGDEAGPRQTRPRAADTPSFFAASPAEPAADLVPIVAGAAGGVVLLCAAAAAFFFYCVLRRSAPDRSGGSSIALQQHGTNRKQQLEELGYDLAPTPGARN